jgi:hypothetical protein
VAAITYSSAKQHIYAFVVGNNGRLYANHWDGAKWLWEDHGKPTTASLNSAPGVTNFQTVSSLPGVSTEKYQRIYVFVVGSEAHLYTNYWDGAKWQWADQGNNKYGISDDLGQLNVESVTPGVITYQDAGKQHIYAFVPAASTNKLYVNYWNGSQWQWAEQSGHSIQSWDSPGVITYNDAGLQRIYAFVMGAELYVNYWNGSQWQWADQGTPEGQPDNMGWGSSPRAITYKDNAGKQRIYAFSIKGGGSSLYVNYWDGAKWQWADQGGSGLVSAPSVITYKDEPITVITQPSKATQHIYAFAVDAYGSLLMNHWDGAKWLWEDHGKPAP